MVHNIEAGRLALPGQRFAVRVIGAVQAGVALGGAGEPVRNDIHILYSKDINKSHE